LNRGWITVEEDASHVLGSLYWIDMEIAVLPESIGDRPAEQVTPGAVF